MHRFATGTQGRSALALASLSRRTVRDGWNEGRVVRVRECVQVFQSASAITRGLAKLMKWGSRSTQPDREASRRRDTEIAMLFMVGSSCRKLFCETTIAHSLGLAAFPITKLMGSKSVSEGCQIPANCS